MLLKKTKNIADELYNAINNLIILRNTILETWEHANFVYVISKTQRDEKRL